MNKNSTVLVTGADGFIGSHLVEMLLEQNFRVRALSQYNSFNYWGWLETISAHENLEIYCGDIRDPHYCLELCEGVDVIFHLAALIAIPYSYTAPNSYVDTNITGTLNICQAALKHKVRHIIHTSTSEVYGTALYVPIDEKHPKQPQSPYSATKISADALAMSYFNSFDLNLTVARPFNAYGPRQSARAFIPTVISQIAKGEKQIKVGDLSPTRDFNFVKDICSAFISLADNKESMGKEINICSNAEISMHDMLNMIKEVMNSNTEFVLDKQRLRPEKSEVNRLWGDNSLLKSITGHSPQYSLKQGIKITCDWFSAPENLKQYKANIYNV